VLHLMEYAATREELLRNGMGVGAGGEEGGVGGGGLQLLHGGARNYDALASSLQATFA